MYANTINDSYRALLEELIWTDYIETNVRTGVRVRILPGGWSFKLDLTEHFPVPGNRRYYPHIAAAETAWQIMGTKRAEFIIEKAPKLWSEFVDIHGKIEAAYGYRWRKHFHRDQFTLAAQTLACNQTDRQIYISAWDPSRDGLGSPNQPKNVPCPTGFSLTRTGQELHLSVFMRSSDVFVGLPYDIMNFTLLAHCFAWEITKRDPANKDELQFSVLPATLHITLAHAHLYEPHWDLTAFCLSAAQVPWPTIRTEYSLVTPWPKIFWSFQEIEENPNGYINMIKRHADNLIKVQWDPKPELVL